MQICVCGWHFLINKKILGDLMVLNKKYPVFIVSHQTSQEANELLKLSNLNYKIIPNIGLEFGSYDWYIKNIWKPIPPPHFLAKEIYHMAYIRGEIPHPDLCPEDKVENNVLFMHDDVDVRDFSEFVRMAELTADQYYVFQDKIEEDANQHRHGRMIYLSAKIIEKMLSTVCECKYAYDWIDQEHNPGCVIQGSGPHTGFWFDPYNSGHTCGKPPVLFTIHHEQKQVSEPKAIWHYNHACFHFDKQMGSYSKEFKVRQIHFAPGLFLGRRNRFRENCGDKYYKIKT